MYEISKIILILAVVFCLGQSMPLDFIPIESYDETPVHELSKRFINPSLTIGDFTSNTFPKIRSRRDLEEECEKLRLCKLHAASSRSFIATFELYFVNKENARLWDHQQHSSSDCDQRYSCYR